MLHFYFLTEHEAKIKFDEECSIHTMLKLLFCEQDCFLKSDIFYHKLSLTNSSKTYNDYVVNTVHNASLKVL